MLVASFTDSSQTTEECSRLIGTIKACLCGEGDGDHSPETVTLVANEIYNQDLLSLFIARLPKLEFEVCGRRPVAKEMAHRP